MTNVPFNNLKELIKYFLNRQFGFQIVKKIPKYYIYDRIYKFS